MLSEALFEKLFCHERSKHPPVILSPALLVIDFQGYFTSRESHAYLDGVERAVDNSADLIDAFAQSRMPVALTVHREGSSMMRDWWGNNVEEQWTVPEFKGFPTFGKNTYDAFHGTDLDAFLQSKGVNQLVVCGVMTHLCCETTARSAFVKGYRIIMVEDALRDKNLGFHVWSLKNLGHGFCSISRTNEILDLLQRR